MARIAGVDLNDKERIDFALTKIKGIGWALAGKILGSLKIDEAKRVSELSPAEVSRLAGGLEKYTIEGELSRKVFGDVKRLKTIGSYRGLRHTRGLPTRGQRTKSNARTRRGKRKTVGAFKKADLAKQTPSQ